MSPVRFDPAGAAAKRRPQKSYEALLAKLAELAVKDVTVEVME